MKLFETIRVESAKAVATFDGLLKEHPKTRKYPFFIGDDEDLAQFQDCIEPPPDGGAAIIAAAAATDVQAWLKSKNASKPKSLAKGVAPQTGWVTLTDLCAGQLKPTINIGVIELERPSQLFAKLGFGGWNDYPEPHIHVAMHGYWNSKHRSFPAALSNGLVECFVPSPPIGAKDALTLAGEQHAYCYDIVEQGFGSKPKLAASLVGAKVWYFWWD
ncbi:MAG: DUF4253 domain-containing protein [Usitatibacteraceae bacterium]